MGSLTSGKESRLFLVLDCSFFFDSQDFTSFMAEGTLKNPYEHLLTRGNWIRIVADGFIPSLLFWLSSVLRSSLSGDYNESKTHPHDLMSASGFTPIGPIPSPNLLCC